MFYPKSMKTFEVYLKGRPEPLSIEGDSIQITGDLFQCRRDKIIVAEFAKQETQMWMEVPPPAVPQITFEAVQSGAAGNVSEPVAVEVTEIER